MIHANWRNEPNLETIRAEIRQCYNMCSRRIDDLSESIDIIQQTTGPNRNRGDKGDMDVSSVVDIRLNVLDESISVLKNRRVDAIDEIAALSIPAECIMFAEEDHGPASVQHHIA